MEVTLCITANSPEIRELLDYLVERSALTVQWWPDGLPPLLGLEKLPSDVQLTSVERAIIQHDL